MTAQNWANKAYNKEEETVSEPAQTEKTVETIRRLKEFMSVDDMATFLCVACLDWERIIGVCSLAGYENLEIVKILVKPLTDRKQLLILGAVLRRHFQILNDDEFTGLLREGITEKELAWFAWALQGAGLIEKGKEPGVTVGVTAPEV